MVWALIISVLLLLYTPSPALADPEPSRASYSVYQSLSPNSQYLDWAESYLPRVGFGEDYVFFRSGQYQYCFARGDLSLSSGTIGGDDIQCTFLNLSSAGVSDSSLTYSSGSFSLVPGNKVIYSNLGDFPTLSPEYFYLECLIFCAVVACVMSILRSIWSFLLRMGVRVHDSSAR